MSTATPPLVAPIRGERYAARENLSDLIAPPYDVIGDDDRRRLGALSPHNIVHLILPDGTGDRYRLARKTLDAWRAAGILVREPEPVVYLLSQEFVTPDGRGFTRTGLLAGVVAEPYERGRVLPHERTHAGPKADRLALIQATGTMFESLFLLAPDRDGRLVAALRQVTRVVPTASAELQGVWARLWRVAGAEARELAAAAGERLYIADGHHRFETAVAYARENPRAARTVGLIVPLGDPGLVVLPTHRLVSGSAVGAETATRVLAGHFRVERIEAELDPVGLLAEAGRAGTAAVVVLPDDGLLMLRLRPGADLSSLGRGTAATLDVARVDGLVVRPLVEAAGPAGKVGYSADAGEVLARVGGGQAAAGVLLNPTRVEDVLAVADQGQVMPQKSTYFVPKVPSGLLLLPLD